MAWDKIICLNCKITFLDYRSNHRKYCSYECCRQARTGAKQSQEHILKRANALRGQKRKPFSEKWRKRIGDASRGRKLSEQARRKLSDLYKGSKCRFWKGGIDTKEYKHHRNVDYKLWRERVFERDNYTCQKCEAHSGNGKHLFLIPHHIKSYTHFPQLRYEVTNGITWCKNCHNKHHWKGA